MTRFRLPYQNAIPLLTLHMTALTGILSQPASSQSAATVMWYDKPAAKWTEALPVGNGRLGAMVFGAADVERIQFNEDTRWSGGPYETKVEGGAAHLDEIRAHLFNGNYRAAHKAFNRHMMGHPVEQQKYQSFGDLMLDFGTGETTGYRRELDLDSAVATTRFTRGGVTFTREVFVPVADQVIVVRITADKPASVSFAAELRGVRNTSHSNYGNDYFSMDAIGGDRLMLRGKSADYLGVEGKLRYEAQLKAITAGGTMKVENDRLIITGADLVTLHLAAATNFENYKSVAADPHTRVEETLRKIDERTDDIILADHLKEHRRLFRRMTVDFGEGSGSRLPTDERLRQTDLARDPALAALVLQFGRYLLIASSRPGTQPANLQGIWNEEMNPKWDSKYTININTQMNYWPAEPGNLTECTEPLFRMIGELSETGSRLAKIHYNCDGWVIHQNTDLWRAGAPMDGPNWGAFTVGGAWLGTHLWEHQLFHPDKEVLARHYPLIKGCAEFFLDYLVPDPRTGKLVTCPSTSPENSPGRADNTPFFDDLAGWLSPGTTLCAGSTIDLQIVADVFHQAAAAAELLDRDSDFRKRVLDAASRLAPMQVGKDGSLQEWLEDWPQSEASHRHISHLYGLYPSHQISPDATPALAQAAAAVLDQRGLAGTGWSSAWKAACWARLRRADKAMENFDHAMANYTCPNLFSLCSGAPQVDGSHGFSAALMEMLVQSHDGEIRLLPCLPATCWPAGSVHGIRARGGFEIDMRWSTGKLVEATVRAERDSKCRIRTPSPLQTLATGGNPAVVSKDGMLEFQVLADTPVRIKALESDASKPSK